MARGRKVNSNGERSKQLLREKAIELFASNGYYQTKISDIVKAANVTQPTFYLYFDSKDSLFIDLNEQFQLNLFRLFEEHPGQNEAHFHQVIINLLQYFSENPLLTKIGLYQSEESYLVKERLVEKFEHILERQKQYFSKLEQMDIHIISQSLVGSIERLTFTLLLTNKKTVDQLTEELLSIYFVKEELLTYAR